MLFLLSRRGLVALAVFFSIQTAAILAVSAQTPAEIEAARRQGPPVIRSIDVQYIGPVTIARERVLAQLRTKVGRPYSDLIAEEDIRSLYASGAVQNVRIFGEPQGDGIRVVVAIETRSVLKEIQLDGVSRISVRKLRKSLGVKLNARVNEADLEKGRQKIIEIYQAHGFTDVTVDFRVEPIDAGRAISRAVYTVDEGTRGAINLVRFEGNSHVSSKILRKQMKTKSKTIISFIDKSGRLDNAQLQQDMESIREYYQNHGYVDMNVREVRKERTRKGALQLVAVIDEGPQYRFGKIGFTGYKNTTEQKLKEVAFLAGKVKEGTVYSPKALKDAGKAIADNYGSGGYVDLEIVPHSVLSSKDVIDVNFTVEEGTRSFVQRIVITGNTRTKDKVLRREVLIAPGDTFNTVRVETSKKRLENLGYFSRVDTYPIESGVEGRKDLAIQVEEKRTGSLNFGGGFSTVDSVVGFAELTQSNFDILSWPNFTGAGQKFRARLQIGTQRQDIELALTEPWFLDRPLSLGGSAFYHEANYLSSIYDQRNLGFSIEARKALFPFVSASVGYRLENFDIFNVQASASQAIKDQAGSSTKSQISSTIVYDHRDNPFLTRTGERISFTTYIAGGFLGGTEQIYGFDAEASKYFHLPFDTIILLNAEVATVDNWGNGNQVRIYDRLFLGGSNNLRGFDFREVGPKDNKGEPLGGKTLARGTVEFTFPIVDKARGALFYDTGILNTNAYDFSDEHWGSDVGIGVRLDLPIGPLRVDYGIPLQRDGNRNSGKFNFNVGYQF